MPALQTFLGGHDVQRSLNLADNRCVNLYPVTNNDGSVAAFQTTPGLKDYAVIPGGAVASGVYTASNGRCFMVAATTLYEITAGGILTSRGTVTTGAVSRMTDNGIELIIVNGIDGWIFTFATNTLEKIKVFRSTFTVDLANPCTITTATAHPFVAGDRFTLSTTGALPLALATSTTYYVLAAGLGANTLQCSLTDGGTAVSTLAGVQSGVHTLTSIGYGFPNGTKTINYTNGRFIACEPNTQNFWVSEPLDGKAWDALNVQTVDSNPDLLIGSIVLHNEIIMFCEQSGEVFYDSGTYPSPFVRNVSGTFEVGCIAPFSIAKIDNSIMWLGKSITGGGIIYRLDGYTPKRISTYAIEYAIQQMSNTADAISFAYQQDGHHFYVITFPTGNRSFVYDANTQLWHERAGFTAGVFTRWEAQEYAFFDNKHLVCDTIEGKIYSLELDYFKDGTATRKWLRSFRSPGSNMLRTVHHKLALEFEGGVGLLGGTAEPISLRYSNDGGHTWSNELWRDLGAFGQYAKRVFWHRLGMTSGQPRIYELSGTEPVKTVLINAFLD